MRRKHPFGVTDQTKGALMPDPRYVREEYCEHGNASGHDLFQDCEGGSRTVLPEGSLVIGRGEDAEVWVWALVDKIEDWSHDPTLCSASMGVIARLLELIPADALASASPQDASIVAGGGEHV